MTMILRLAVGDSSPTDVLDLNDGVHYIMPPGSFRAPPALVRTFRSRRADTTQKEDPFRTVAFDLQVFGTSDNSLYDTYIRPIQQKIEQARANWGNFAEQPVGVCLWVGFGTNPVFFDVIDGQLTILRNDNAWGPTPGSLVAVDLKCAVYAHGTAQTFSFSQTHIGTSSVFYMSSLGGDAPGLVQATLVDGSSSGAIDRYRIGTYSLYGAASSAYTPWTVATAAGIGTSFADPSSLNGTNTIRSAPTGAMQTVAQMIGSNAAGMHGVFDAWLLIRDSSALLFPPSSLSVQLVTTTGTLHQGTYVFDITAVDVSGNETAATGPVTISQPNVANVGEFVVTWPASTGGVANYRVYAQGVIGNGGAGTAWGYKTVAAPTTTLTVSVNGATGWTSVNPPSISAAGLLGCTLQLQTGVVGTDNAVHVGYTSKPLIAVLGNNQREMVPAGTLALPPLAPQEGQAVPNWGIVAQAQAGTGSPTLDIEGILLLKHNQPSMDVRNIGLATGNTTGTVVVDNRRDGAVSALVSKTGGYLGTATALGRLELGPGNGFIAVDADKTDGTHDVVATQQTLSVRFTPRYNYLIGTGP